MQWRWNVSQLRTHADATSLGGLIMCYKVRWSRNTGTYRPDLSKNCTINFAVVPTQLCYQREHRQAVYNNNKRLTSIVEATWIRELHGNVSYWDETHDSTQTRNCKMCTDPALIVGPTYWWNCLIQIYQKLPWYPCFAIHVNKIQNNTIQLFDNP